MAAKAAIGTHIRWLIRRDSDEVLDIDRQSFEFPWDQEELVRNQRQRTMIGMVAEYDEKVIGFMVYELMKTKLKIERFAVHLKYRRTTVGRQMMDKLTSKLSTQRRTLIVANVRAKNLGGQLFLRACGFRATGVIREHFNEDRDDAYTMVYRFGYPCAAAQPDLD